MIRYSNAKDYVMTYAGFHIYFWKIMVDSKPNVYYEVINETNCLDSRKFPFDVTLGKVMTYLENKE